MENSSKVLRGVSVVRRSRIIARGHPYSIEMNFSRIIGSDVANICTRPSERFITVPATCRSVAILRTQARNPTLWTLPVIRISTVFTRRSPTLLVVVSCSLNPSYRVCECSVSWGTGRVIAVIPPGFFTRNKNYPIERSACEMCPFSSLKNASPCCGSSASTMMRIKGSVPDALTRAQEFPLRIFRPSV